MHFNRQGPPIQATLQRLNLQRYTIVVDSIAAMNACVPIFRRVIETDARAKVVSVSSAFPMQERQNERIELTGAADVFDIGIEFVP